MLVCNNPNIPDRQQKPSRAQRERRERREAEAASEFEGVRLAQPAAAAHDVTEFSAEAPSRGRSGVSWK